MHKHSIFLLMFFFQFVLFRHFLSRLKSVPNPNHIGGGDMIRVTMRKSCQIKVSKLSTTCEQFALTLALHFNAGKMSFGSVVAGAIADQMAPVAMDPMRCARCQMYMVIQNSECYGAFL